MKWFVLALLVIVAQGVKPAIKARLLLAARLGVATLILWRVYAETGAWTVLALTLSFVAAEASAFYAVNIWAVVKLEMQDRHNEKTIAELRARLGGVSYK